MNVVSVCAEHIGGGFRNVSEILILAACSCYSVGELLSFFVSLAREVTRKDIVSFAVLMKVEGDGLELHRSAALNEDDVIVLGNVHKLTKKTFCFVVDCIIVL